MLSNDEGLAEEFERSRPGMQLIWIEDAALPFSWVKLDVLAQERKPFPLLEEFTLRAVESGLSSEGDIGLLLGLGAEIVSATVADLMQRDYIARKIASDGKWRIALTPLGIGAAKELSAVSPTRTQIGFAFDRLKWRVTAFRRGDLISHTEASERGMRILPGHPSDLSEADFAPQALNRLLSNDEESEDRIEILVVQKMTPKARLLLPVKLLIFSDKEASETQVGIMIDGELSREHELEVERLGGAETLGIRVGPPLLAPLGELSKEAISQRVPLEELARLRASAAEPSEQTSQLGGGSATNSGSGHDVLSGLDIRALSVHEHRTMLLDAISSARQRLLIVTPWVKRAIVNEDFLNVLERRLHEKVKVTIVYGEGSDDRGSDESALESLRKLQRRFSKRFDLVRVENAHPRTLVWDDSWVLTNFTWLSFKGDLARTYRMEEGTLIRLPTLVDEAYDRSQAAIARERSQIGRE